MTTTADTNVTISPSPATELANPLSSFSELEKESISSETSEMETFEVELVKDKFGIGITIAGYVSQTGEYLLQSCC